MAVRYKIRELSTVTDDALERVINEMSERGWVLDGIQFAMRDASRRPSMAFVLFTREEPEEGSGPRLVGGKESSS